MKRIEELRNTQAILDNNPALALSPGDLMRESRTVKECLADFIESDQEKYRDYYEIRRMSIGK